MPLLSMFVLIGLMAAPIGNLAVLLLLTFAVDITVALLLARDLHDIRAQR